MRFMKRSAALLLVTQVAVVSVGLVATNSAIAESRAPSSSRPPSCKASMARVSLGPRISDRTMQDSISFEFVNESGATCVVDGFPQVALYAAGGASMPFVYTYAGDAEVIGGHADTVVLRPRATAYSTINQQACTLYTKRQAVDARVTIAGDESGVVISIRNRPVISYCQPDDPSAGSIAVSPFEPTLAATLKP
jgi:hypothetical protein